MLDLRLRQRRVRAHPRIDQHDAGDRRVAARLDVHQRGGRRVAQSPEHDTLHGRTRAPERRDRGGDVVGHVLEAARLATGVSHAAIVEAHRRDAFAREPAREVHELAMTAGAVLRPADDDQDADRGRSLGNGDDADQPLAVAFERERLFARAHERTARQRRDASRGSAPGIR